MLMRAAPRQLLPLTTGRRLAILLALVVAGCAAVRHDVPRPLSHVIDDAQQTALGRGFAAQLAATPGQSGFRLLPSGQEAFLIRAALAEAAQRSLDLQYHIVAPDVTGTLLLYRALRAAQRGVRVRLLIDDLDVAGRDEQLATLAALPHVQVRVFNPYPRRGVPGWSPLFDYLISDGKRLNQRMHNKLWIADNAAALIGGRNLGDPYFNADGQNNFADLDVLAAGPVVAQASRSFDEYWNSEWAVPIEAFVAAPASPAQAEQLMAELTARAGAFRDTEYARALRASPLGQMVRNGSIALIAADAKVIYDRPDKLDDSPAAPLGPLITTLRETIGPAQHRLTLVSPYFVPHERGIDLLCGLARRGVRVRVLTNSLASTDVAAVHAGYARYRPRLLACGVALFELRPSVLGSGKVRRVLSSGVSLHAKAIVVDGRSVVIGSMNLDPRSRSLNTEVAVSISSEALAQQLDAWFDEAASLDRSFQPALSEPGNPAAALVWAGRDDDLIESYTSEPLASWWQRLVAGLLGLLVPEEQL